VPKMQRGQAIRVSETVKKKVWQRYR
jgi:hypothetical protein